MEGAGNGGAGGARGPRGQPGHGRSGAGRGPELSPRQRGRGWRGLRRGTAGWAGGEGKRCGRRRGRDLAARIAAPRSPSVGCGGAAVAWSREWFGSFASVSRGSRGQPAAPPGRDRQGSAGAAAAGFALCRVRSERGPVSYCNSCFPRGVAAFGAEMGSGCRVSVAVMKLHVNGLHLPPGPAVWLSGGCEAAETPQPQPRCFAVGSGGTQENKPCRGLGVTD